MVRIGLKWMPRRLCGTQRRRKWGRIAATGGWKRQRCSLRGLVGERCSVLLGIEAASALLGTTRGGGTGRGGDGAGRLRGDELQAACVHGGPRRRAGMWIGESGTVCNIPAQPHRSPCCQAAACGFTISDFFSREQSSTGAAPGGRSAARPPAILDPLDWQAIALAPRGNARPLPRVGTWRDIPACAAADPDGVPRSPCPPSPPRSPSPPQPAGGFGKACRSCELLALPVLPLRLRHVPRRLTAAPLRAMLQRHVHGWFRRICECACSCTAAGVG
jgi:hypothetical protein